MDFIHDPNLVLYLPLYELDGSSFMSKDAYRHLCTVTGANWILEGRSFDGLDDEIICGNNACLSIARGTILAWIKPATITGLTDFVAGLPYDDGAVWDDPWVGFQLIQRNDKLRWAASVGGTFHQFDSDAGELVIGVWYQAGITWDGTTARLYKNGLEIKNSTSVGSGDITYGSPIPTFVVGQRSKNVPGEHWPGTLGEVWHYSRPLTRQEIQHNYLATKWRYR